LTVHPQKSASAFLELHCSQWQWLPLARRLRLYLCDLRRARSETTLKESYDYRSVEKVIPRPIKVDLDAVLLMHDFDTPESFRHKVPNALIPLDYKA
jgi:hypothetical protein